MDAIRSNPSGEERGPARTSFFGKGWRGWFFAIVLAGALVGAVLQFGEIEKFAALVAHARPAWLALAVALQLLTYASVAMGWRLVLRAGGTTIAMRRLVPVAITKLFADQAVPSAGMGGNVLLVDQLEARGASRGAAVAALLVSMIGFYAAFALLAVLMLALLWFHDKATPLAAGLVTLFLAVAFAIPALALWLRKRGRRRLPRIVERIGPVRSLMETIAEAPSDLLGNRRLIAQVSGCNALIFLADAGTMFVCLHALGVPASFGVAFIAVIMAQIVVTLGPIPLGLGSFEATSTATLRLLGIPFEAAFAATMLLRVLILWLPLIPGMILMRGVLRHRGGESKDQA
jgi:uncharacterized protein (TIRG00374 family)